MVTTTLSPLVEYHKRSRVIKQQPPDTQQSPTTKSGAPTRTTRETRHAFRGPTGTSSKHPDH